MVVRDAPDFKLRFAKVHQQAQPKARGPEVVQALSDVDVIEVLDGLQFKKKNSIYQKVGRVLAYWYSVIADCDHMLLFGLQACLAQLMC